MKFKELKEEICRRAKAKNACADEYKKVLKAKNQRELIKLVKDNFSWCYEEEVIDAELLSYFTEKITNDAGIYYKGVIEQITDRSGLILCGSVKVVMLDSSTVQEMRGSSIVQKMWDGSTIRKMLDSSTVQEMRGSSSVQKMLDRSSVQMMRGSSTVQEMRGRSTVQEMWDSSTVQMMRGSSSVQEMWDSSTIRKMLDRSSVQMMLDSSSARTWNENKPTQKNKSILINYLSMTIHYSKAFKHENTLEETN